MPGTGSRNATLLAKYLRTDPEMARYFFDIDDGKEITHDDTGMECDTHQQMRDAAIKILPQVAVDVLPNGERHVFVVKVRDEGGDIIYIATLSLIAEWIKEPIA